MFLYPSTALSLLFLLLHRSELLIDKVPVDEGPEEVHNVISPLVLVVQVVRVLPNIHSEDGDLALSDGETSADSFVHNQLAGLGIPRQPSPAGAECRVSSSFKLLFEFIIGAEILLDLFRDRAGSLATALWLHALPVEVVIPRLRRVVEERLHVCVRESV
jgi:hypothetical protein